MTSITPRPLKVEGEFADARLVKAAGRAAPNFQALRPAGSMGFGNPR